MKKFFTIIFLILLTYFLIFLFKMNREEGVLNFKDGKISIATTSEDVLNKTGQIIIKNTTWEVEIASTVEERASGLSNRRTLYNKKGMLFVFPKPAIQNFWMKDMLMPIDMVFLDENWQIVGIESNLQPGSFPKLFTGGEVLAKYVLEINAKEVETYNLQIGDQAIFLNK